jgi:hypothetical protein
LSEATPTTRGGRAVRKLYDWEFFGESVEMIWEMHCNASNG